MAVLIYKNVDNFFSQVGGDIEAFKAAGYKLLSCQKGLVLTRKGETLKSANVPSDILSGWGAGEPLTGEYITKIRDFLLEEFTQLSGTTTPTKAPLEAPPFPPEGATKKSNLYAKTGGTSAGSVYIIVAESNSMVVSARYKNGMLSLRADPSGDKFSGAQMVRLAKASLQKKDEGHYSIHLSCGDKGLVRKTVGSVLASIQENWTTPIPQMGNVFGKGA